MAEFIAVGGGRTASQRRGSGRHLVGLSSDEPGDEERQRDERRDEENDGDEEDGQRPPGERQIVVADRREEAAEGISEAEAPSARSGVPQGYPDAAQYRRCHVWSMRVIRLP